MSLFRSAVLFLLAGLFLMPVLAEPVSRQLEKAPEDPSFLYETRHIPGLESRPEFLSPEVEAEVVVQTLSTNSEENRPLNVTMPSLLQIAVVIGIILLFTIYRMQISRKK